MTGADPAAAMVLAVAPSVPVPFGNAPPPQHRSRGQRAFRDGAAGQPDRGFQARWWRGIMAITWEVARAAEWGLAAPT